jgi:phage-related protein
MGNSLESLSSFPKEVKREIGFALRLAQQGEIHECAKPYKGCPGVFESKEQGAEAGQGID